MNREDKMIQIIFKRQRKKRRVEITEIGEKWEGNELTELHSPSSVSKTSSNKFIFREEIVQKNEWSERKKNGEAELGKLFLKETSRECPELQPRVLEPRAFLSLQHLQPHFSWNVRFSLKCTPIKDPVSARPTLSCSQNLPAGHTAAEYSQNWKMSLLLEESERCLNSLKNHSSSQLGISFFQFPPPLHFFF